MIAEPLYTMGVTNQVRWTPVNPGSWDGGSITGDGKPSSRRHFQVDVRNDATGVIRTIDQVPGGQNASSDTVQQSQFPAPPSGRTFSYRVRTSEWECQSGEPGLNTCDGGHVNRYSAYSDWVASTQDATAPVIHALTLAGGALYTSSLRVLAQVDAADPGPNPSGLSALQIGSQPDFSCSLRAVCSQPFTTTTTVSLSSGPDGPRSVFARAFDRAQPPGGLGRPGDPFGQPSGNASEVATAHIVVDTTGPRLDVSRSPEPQKAAKPGAFDGSRSVDAGGFSADSGVDGGTAVWDFGDGSKSSGLVVSHSYASAGTYHATFSLKDRAGNESTLSVPVTVMPSDWGGTGAPTQTTGMPTSTPPTVDTTAPRLSGLRVRHSGARLRLTATLSEPATLLVRVERVRPRPQVVLFGRRASLAAGPASLVLGRVNSQLKHARYRVLVAARDRAGNVSATRLLTIG